MNLGDFVGDATIARALTNFVAWRAATPAQRAEVARVFHRDEVEQTNVDSSELTWRPA